MNNQSNNSNQNSMQTEMQSSQNSQQPKQQSSQQPKQQSSQQPKHQNSQQPKQQSSQQPKQQANQGVPDAQPVPAAADYTEPAPVPAKKRGGSKGLIIAIIAVVLAAIIAAAVIFVPKLLKKGDGNADPALKTTLLQKSGDGTVTTLAFYPTTNLSKSELADAAKTIEERVSILGEDFEISSDKEKITLTIKNELLGSTALEKAMTADLITSRGNLYFGSQYFADTEITPDDIESFSVEEVDKDDFINEYVIYFDDETDGKYSQLKSIKSDKLFAMKITLADSIAETFTEEVEYYIDSDYPVFLYHDVLPESPSDYNEFLGTVLFEDEDDLSTFYLACPGATYEKYPELLENIIYGKDLPAGFVTKIMDEPLWETDTKKFGDNQVESLDGKAIVIKCTPDDFTLGYTSDVELEKFKQVIKNRLDYLGTDYMFGVTGFDGKTMCVKISPKELGPDFVRMIFSTYEISLLSSFDEIASYNNIELVDNDGKFGIKYETYNTYEEIIAEYNIPNGSVYLVVNDLTIATADISTMNEDNEIVFENFLCFDSAEATKDDMPILDLICSINDESYIHFNGTFEIEYVDGDKKLDYDDIDWKYTSRSKIDNDVAKIIRDMGHKSVKTIDERNMLTITLNVDIDENLPSAFLEEVKNVYYACNFDGGAYNKIIFVVKDEKKNSPADEFRIEFEKNTYQGKMIADFWVTGPTFDDYWWDSYELEENDPFMIEHEYTW